MHSLGSKRASEPALQAERRQVRERAGCVGTHLDECLPVSFRKKMPNKDSSATMPGEARAVNLMEMAAPHARPIAMHHMLSSVEEKSAV